VVVAESEEEAKEIVRKDVGGFEGQDKITTVERFNATEKGMYFTYSENHRPDAP
jgi:hypothetical protein